MSKDDTCKVTSASKHKERKPKKPHYIPRPWGKPYNYKCFQCPFTCMEKSHLYNHMKYSLCKNSLSLLIESDWPYKKGNILHPERSAEEDGEGRDSQGPEDEEGRGEGFLRARSVEVEAQLRHYKLSKTCLTAPGLLSEQWRLLASSHTKAKAEGPQPRVNNSIPCYPPPPNLVDYQDPTGLNLSVLGVGYPISPGIFSYMNSLAQLPFLASAAQLIHPASSAHADRALIPPRLYYPFLCEHTFGQASSQSDASKPLKTSTNTLEASPLSSFQPKVNLWKVPAVRPGSTITPAGWVSPQRDSPDQGYRNQEDAHVQGRPTELWYNDPLISPTSETSSLSTCGRPNSQDSAAARTIGASESVAALLGDLSKALQEYHEAERKISHLEKEDLPAQRHLWEHLNKIRSELSHIHQALERTARQSDGPLDLSVKRDSTESVGDQSRREDGGLKENATETEEEDEELIERREDEEDESERKVIRASLESRKQSLDMLIKMSQASVVNTEVLSPGGLGLRPSPAEALWASRTTKCEADSSVLLCPDGRSVVFTDIPSSAKPPKRPPSIQRLEAHCPPSPLTATDN
uniref:Zinc finger protein 750-like zinc finger domain-containing protein n=1 Tax=Oreochromis aureus TaxID=47969 RepID=A0A668S5W8_OREAU